MNPREHSAFLYLVGLWATIYTLPKPPPIARDSCAVWWIRVSCISDWWTFAIVRASRSVPRKLAPDQSYSVFAPPESDKPIGRDWILDQRQEVWSRRNLQLTQCFI